MCTVEVVQAFRSRQGVLRCGKFAPTPLGGVLLRPSNACGFYGHRRHRCPPRPLLRSQGPVLYRTTTRFALSGRCYCVVPRCVRQSPRRRHRARSLGLLHRAQICVSGSVGSPFEPGTAARWLGLPASVDRALVPSCVSCTVGGSVSSALSFSSPLFRPVSPLPVLSSPTPVPSSPDVLLCPHRT